MRAQNGEQTRRSPVDKRTPTDPMTTLKAVAQQLVAPGKGILAADESFPTIEKRFKPLGITSTDDNRRAYRETLFTAPELGRSISGVILFDETLRQKSQGGIPLAGVLESQGIIPGIKVDKGAVDLANFAGEKITEGLDGLRDRLTEYRTLGARFTKWRAVIGIAGSSPSRTCIEANVLELARFAALSQEAGLVPIVEPEVLMDGDHTIARCEEVTDVILPALFSRLDEHRVKLDGLLLKCAMILPGTKNAAKVDDDEIARRTLACLKRNVMSGVAGIVFLSGGQSPEEATRRLAAINRAGPAPWPLTFSFGRALQDPALKAWKGLPENVAKAQAALVEVAQANSRAVMGKTPGTSA